MSMEEEMHQDAAADYFYEQRLVALLREHDERQSWAGSSYNGSDLQRQTRAAIGATTSTGAK